MYKKTTCLLLTLILVIGTFTFTAFAAGTNSAPNTSDPAEEIQQLKDQLKDANDQIAKLQAPKSNNLSPNVLIDSFSYGSGAINGSSKFTLKYALKNTSSNITIQNIVVKVSGGENFSLVNSSDSSYITSIAPNGTVQKSIDLSAGLTIESGSYPVNLHITYEYFDNNERANGTSELSIAIPVSQTDKFKFDDVKTAGTAYVDREQNVVFKLVNTGYTVLKNCNISILDSTGKVLATAFYGKVDASSQIDDASKLSITPDKEGETKYILKLNYEDKYATPKEHTQEFTINAKIYKNPYEDENAPVDGET
ncbi:MAG: hypothetical protein RR069_06855, partial [Oscillospiraceae bacterium]